MNEISIKVLLHDKKILNLVLLVSLYWLNWHIFVRHGLEESGKIIYTRKYILAPNTSFTPENHRKFYSLYLLKSWYTKLYKLKNWSNNKCDELFIRESIYWKQPLLLSWLNNCDKFIKFVFFFNFNFCCNYTNHRRDNCIWKIYL